MGKLFAALILVIMIGWLGPMCAKLGTQDPVVTAPAPAPQPESPAAAPVAASTAALVSAGAVEPAPAPKPAPERPVRLSTYLSRTMFPEENGKYIVSVLRANKAGVPASGARMTLTTRMQGQIVERVESGPAQILPARSTSYFGLGVSTVVFDELLDGPEDRRSGLEWSLTYRFASDAPGAIRCFRLRALPRRLEPAGITWLVLGESQKCDPDVR